MGFVLSDCVFKHSLRVFKKKKINLPPKFPKPKFPIFSKKTTPHDMQQ